MDDLPSRVMRVEPVKVAEFVRALGLDPEPGYAAVEGAPVPPGYLTYAASYDPTAIHTRLGFDPRRTLYAGLELDILEVPLVGDVLEVRPRVGPPRTAEGHSGPLRLVEVEVEYHRAGRLIMRERSTVVERGTARA